MRKLIATLIILFVPTIGIAHEDHSNGREHVKTQDAVYKCKKYMDKSRFYHWRAHTFPWGYSRNHAERDHWENKANHYCGEAQPKYKRVQHKIINKNIINNHIDNNHSHSSTHHKKTHRIKVLEPEYYQGKQPKYGYKDELRPEPKAVDLESEVPEEREADISAKDGRNPAPRHD